MLLVLFLSIFGLISGAGRSRRLQAAEVLEHLENGNEAAAHTVMREVLKLPVKDRFTAPDFLTLSGIPNHLAWFTQFPELNIRNNQGLRNGIVLNLEKNVLPPVLTSDRQDLKDKWSEYKSNDGNMIQISFHAFELKRQASGPPTVQLDMAVLGNKIDENKNLIRAVYTNPNSAILLVLLPHDQLKSTLRFLANAKATSLKDNDLAARIGHDTAVAPMARREFMLFLWKKILDPNFQLFVSLPEAQFKFAVNPAMAKVLLGGSESEKEQVKKYYIAVGRLLAMAILHDEVLPFEFVSSFYKNLHKTRVSLEDMKDFDEDIYQQLTQLRANPDMVQDMDLTFSVTKQVPGGYETISLLMNGENESVTPRTCNHYVDRLVAYECYEQVKPQMELIREGFDSLISLNEFRDKFNWKELAALLSKHVPIDVADWRAHTEVKHVTPEHSALVDALFNFLADERSFQAGDDLTITAAEKRSLILYFWSRMRRAPQNGFKDIKFTISCMENHGPLMVRSCAKIIFLKRTTHEALVETLKTIIIQYSTGALQ